MLRYTLLLILSHHRAQVSSISRFKTGSFLVPSGWVLGSLPYETTKTIISPSNNVQN